MNARKVVIDIEHLSAYYGSRQVLKDINLTVHEGEIMVIMGGSGSGKTTLLRHILGLLPSSSCHIRLLGKDITTMSDAELYELRTIMGVAFQAGALLGSMSVLENVELPLREHTKLDENTIRIMSRIKLELVNLAGADDLMPAELSGGMLKRAALARAVVMDPKLLFFDEPSSGLDPVVAAELDEMILKLRDAMKMTIVIVTHDLESAFKIADRIAILDNGEILTTGTVPEIRACPIKRVQDLLNRRPRNETVDGEAYLQRLTGENS